MSLYNLNNIFFWLMVTFFCVNSIGYIKFYTGNFGIKNTKSTKELTVHNCQFVFKEVNDIHHFVKAFKIKVPEYLPCHRKVNIKFYLKCFW